MTVVTPLLSEKDPVEASEGSIDPLGTYAIGDRLAVRLVPGVRERMGRPRLVTAMAVSHAVRQGLDEDTVGADGKTEPEQVFEWYLVEGLVRWEDNVQEVRQLPGLMKARQAIRDGVPLSPPRYLKTPKIFGFHGIYRPLARDLGVEQEGYLGERGVELLETWAREQGVDGFSSSPLGSGRPMKERLHRAIREGLESGAVARGAGWSGWSFFADHLAPAEIGSEEAEMLGEGLRVSGAGFRREVLDALVSAEGQRHSHHGQSEREFHLWLRDRAEGDLRQLLDAILAYEAWSRLLQDAFEDCRHCMTRTRSRTSIAHLAEMPAVREGAKRAPDAFSEAAGRLQPYPEEETAFRGTFSSLGEPVDPQAWAHALLDHHRWVQRQKPPDGKSPWVESFDDGTTMVRPGYRREEGARGDGSYVHQYRTGPLWSFAKDLRMVGE